MENKSLQELTKEELLELATNTAEKMKTIDSKIEKIELFYNTTFNDVGDKQSTEKRIIELVDNLNSTKITVDKYNKDLFHGNGVPSIQSKIDTLVQEFDRALKEIREKNDEVLNLHNELIVSEEGRESIKGQVLKLQEQFSKNLLENANQLNDLKTIHELIFGNSGSKQRIELFEKQIQEDQKNWEKKFETLYSKIEGLLPGATSTGLAQAYQDQRKRYNVPYWLWAIVFGLTIIGMISFSISTLHDAKDINDAFMRLLSRLPFFIPAFWLAYFSSKQQSQNKRLQEEYSYKESLAKSYEGHKREVEKLGGSEEEINKLVLKLMDAMVDMARYNPSETLQHKGHNDKPPILSNISALTDKKGKEE